MKYFVGHIWKSVFEHSVGVFLSSIDRPGESSQIAVLLFAKLLMDGVILRHLIVYPEWPLSAEITGMSYTPSTELSSESESLFVAPAQAVCLFS